MNYKGIGERIFLTGPFLSDSFLQIVTAGIFPGETITKLRWHGFFLLEYSIKSGRECFFLEKVRGGVKISNFQYSKSLPVTLEVSIAAEKYQPSDGTQFFVELRVSDQNCPNVL